VRWHVLACDPLFDRDGVYDSPWGAYADNGERFAVFCRASLAAVEALGLAPDIVHAHDWQAGLAPVYLRTHFAGRPAFAAARSVLTLHNVAYQGRFGPDVLPVIGFDEARFNPAELEFYGYVSFLKGGAAYADALTAVSPRYALEIQTPGLGVGLDGLLRFRARGLHGILNGIDVETWDPATDPDLPAHYDASDLAGKAACKRHVQWRFGLPERADAPLIAFIGRFAEQKGVDLLLAVLPDLLREDVQVLVLGTGNAAYRDAFVELCRRAPHRLGIFLGFDESLAHRIEAGADMLVMPSRYEPCGLNQLYSVRYGTVPIVRETGGLADTVVDAAPEAIREGRATGFVFRDFHPGAFRWAIDRARAAFADPPAWRALVRNGMRQDVSWARSARRYVELFQSLLPPASRDREAPKPRRARRVAELKV
jgi:starch synthase